MADATAPYGYDEAGNTIESVTVTASRLPRFSATDLLLIGVILVTVVGVWRKKRRR